VQSAYPKRPLERKSRVATDLANTAGWCSGRMTTLVPRLMLDVAAATRAHDDDVAVGEPCRLGDRMRRVSRPMVVPTMPAGAGHCDLVASACKSLHRDVVRCAGTHVRVERDRPSRFFLFA